jgi:putative oxidoreductase
MNSVVQNLPVRLGAWTLSTVRIVVSFLFASHGAAKIFGVLGGVDRHGGPAPIGSWPTWWAGAIELVAGVMVLLGLLTRSAALLCSGAMAFAYFTVHQPRGLLALHNGGEPAALFCWIFLLIAALGPGPFALDAVLRRGHWERKPSGKPAASPAASGPLYLANNHGGPLGTAPCSRSLRSVG